MGVVVKKYRLELVKESSKIYNVDDKMTSPRSVANYMEQVFNMSSQAEEIFVMLVLDIKNKVIGAFEVSRGNLSSSIVHPREVFKRAILLNGNAIIVGHNHPSGNPAPSEEDKKVTKRLDECGNLLGIKLLDHIIIGDEGSYYSHKEYGII